MRRFLLTSTAIFALTTASAQAGGMAEPVMTPVTVAQATTSSSSGGLVVPLLLLLVLAAAVSSGGGGGGGANVSDIRLKTDIRRVGTTHLGLPLYQFRYTDLPQIYEGVMAQDVAIMHPGAIRKLPYGYMAVDYAKLGLEMRRVA
jgi:hypothetical protein